MKIKNLVWRDDLFGDDLITAQSVGYIYHIRRLCTDYYRLIITGGEGLHEKGFTNLTETQAAANDHHKQRIMEWIEVGE